MANVIYNSTKKKTMDADIDFAADTIKVALVTSTYTPNQDTHEFFDDITNEITGTGYTAGGATLGSKTVTQDNANNKSVFDAGDASWNGTITTRGAVIYKYTGTDSTSPLIRYVDFGSDQSVTTDDFTIQWNAGGIMDLGDA